mmetsp:Transcript_27371/g.64117  ORF Transcript_27371/g.64117 Transcript_27371/m.64117 type:complete len:178 (+) Transcript_27371:482-1015(+)
MHFFFVRAGCRNSPPVYHNTAPRAIGGPDPEGRPQGPGLSGSHGGRQKVSGMGGAGGDDKNDENENDHRILTTVAPTSDFFLSTTKQRMLVLSKIHDAATRGPTTIYPRHVLFFACVSSLLIPCYGLSTLFGITAEANFLGGTFWNNLLIATTTQCSAISSTWPRSSLLCLNHPGVQ